MPDIIHDYPSIAKLTHFGETRPQSVEVRDVETGSRYDQIGIGFGLQDGAVLTRSIHDPGHTHTLTIAELPGYFPGTVATNCQKCGGSLISPHGCCVCYEVAPCNTHALGPSYLEQSDDDGC